MTHIFIGHRKEVLEQYNKKAFTGGGETETGNLNSHIILLHLENRLHVFYAVQIVKKSWRKLSILSLIKFSYYFLSNPKNARHHLDGDAWHFTNHCYLSLKSTQRAFQTKPGYNFEHIFISFFRVKSLTCKPSS